MKFAICIVALALMATIEAAPAPVGTYGDGSDPPVLASVYFENNLDGIQGALTDIEAAGIDLATIKGKLEALADGAPKIYAAESALETAVDSAAYTNAFVEGPACDPLNPPDPRGC